MITGSIDSILENETSDPGSVSPDTMFDAIKLMAKKTIGSLLVAEAKKSVGIASERVYTLNLAIEQMKTLIAGRFDCWPMMLGRYIPLPGGMNPLSGGFEAVFC